MSSICSISSLSCAPYTEIEEGSKEDRIKRDMEGEEPFESEPYDAPDQTKFISLAEISLLHHVADVCSKFIKRYNREVNDWCCHECNRSEVDKFIFLEQYLEKYRNVKHINNDEVYDSKDLFIQELKKYELVFQKFFEQKDLLRVKVDGLARCPLKGSITGELRLAVRNGGKLFTKTHTKVVAALETMVFTKPTNSWVDFIPPAAVVLTGSMISSSFRVGVQASMAELALVLTVVFLGASNEKEPTGSSYQTAYYKRHVFHSAVIGPVLEEIEFRGILQPFITAITGSSNIGILSSSICFGAIHVNNEHEYKNIQAVAAGATALWYGFLRNQFGMMAPIGAHIFHNMVLGTLLHM